MDSANRTACQICGKYFYTAVSLRMHTLRVHGKAEESKEHSKAIGKKGSVCTVCNRCFPNDGLLKTHTVTVHCGTGAAPDIETGKQHVESVSKKGSVCIVCNLCFPTANSLKVHTLKAHTATVNTGCEMQTSTKQQCTDCGRYFVNIKKTPM